MLTNIALLAGCATLAVAIPAPVAQPVSVPVGRGARHYEARSDGALDVHALFRSIDKTLHKYGHSTPEDRFAGLSVKRAVGKEPLTDQVESNQDIEYYGNAQVGAAKQVFTVDFDTGSADFFVPGPKCGSSQGCVGTTKYNQQGRDEGNTTSITYGSGMVEGENYFDTVCVAGLCAANTNVISLTQAQGFASSASNSLMGMGFSTIANSRQPTFFERLMALKVVSANKFGFYLGRAASNTQGASELTLGGADSSKYTGAVVAHPVTQKGYWQIAVAGVTIGGSMAANSAGQSAIDTGTTVIIAPTDAARAIYQKLGGFPVPLASGSASETIYAYPCNAKVLPAFQFGTTTYAINPLDFSLGSISPGLAGLFSPGGLKGIFSGTKYCAGAIIGADLIPGEKLYIVGDSFLKNWYSIYSYDNGASVSFAKAV